MTKKVRIENADTSTYKVLVELWDKDPNGGPDVLVSTTNLDYPTTMAELCIHSSRFIVIKENGYW